MPLNRKEKKPCPRTTVPVSDRTYSSAIQITEAALNMAVAMQNVVSQLALYARQKAGSTPLEFFAEHPMTDNKEE